MVEQGMYKEYKWGEVVVIMDVKMKLARENIVISIAIRVVEDQLMDNIGMKGGQMDSVNNMVKASMIETTGSNKFRVMFGMMEGEVEWLKRRRVFLLGLGVGMELHHRREVIGGGRAGFLMAWSRGGSTSFLLVWGRNWVEGILKKILGVVERESGRSQQPTVVM